jgi:phosphohistidine phosphatase SixA
VAVCDALAPGGSHAAVIDELGNYARLDRVALVGHQPDLGHLAARLIGAGAALDFKKGAVCRIDVGSVPPAKAGTLKWFVTPKMLRRMGKGKGK